MNQPMQSTKPIKEIYAKSAGINLPPRVKKLLIGAEIVWFDADPFSQDMRDLHYLTKQLEFGMVPDDHKNKKFYETTKFRAVVVNV